MDGVLYDSMPGHSKAWVKMFDEIGIKTTPEEFFYYEGMTGGATIDLVFQRELGKTAEEEEKKKLYARKTELFSASHPKKVMRGTKEVLELLRRGGLNPIVVTGSGQQSLLATLNQDFPGFFPRERVVCALDVTKGKPDPEPYLKGALKAGVSPREAMAVENAPLGVRSAKAAGCFTVAVMTGPLPRKVFEDEGADMIFPSMSSFAAWLKDSGWLSERGEGLAKRIDLEVGRLNPSSVLVVTDSNVKKKVFPLLEKSEVVSGSECVMLRPGEKNKSLRSLEKIWEALERTGATRKSVIVNIGGGLVTDIGGFAAATFKRGIRYVNVPTTLLGAVDAATGGKTAVNFHGLKNEIGAFHNPSSVVISALPLGSLPLNELLSGYAEMLKTALIADENLFRELLDVDKIMNDSGLLEEAMKKCVGIKEGVVKSDPREEGLRKILNFGHTAGHAFESLYFDHIRNNPDAGFLNHGIAVAHGMLVELVLSGALKDFPEDEVAIYADLLNKHYPPLPLPASLIKESPALMRHDKKNETAVKANFTLLENIGCPVIDCYPTDLMVSEAIDRYLKLTGKE